jgi:pilus assembly protein Flp/PilA
MTITAFSRDQFRRRTPLADRRLGHLATGQPARFAGGVNTRRSNMLTNLKKLFRDEQGATAVEYGMIVAGIAAVIVTIVFGLGVKVNTAFTTVNNKLP